MFSFSLLDSNAVTDFIESAPVIAVNKNLKTTQRKQRTLARPITLSGIGVHTGQEVTMKFLPAKDNHGIAFRRTDLPNTPVVPATVQYVCDTSRSTTIGVANKFIHTVEHVLAAVRAFDIDNLCIEVSNVEPPICEGNSVAFVDMIEQAGIIAQSDMMPIVKLQEPLYWSEGDIHLVALPYDGFRISYTLNYPDSKVLKSQFYSVLVNSSNFKKEIAPCRTFLLYKEIAALMDKGLIKGGSLGNAVVIQDDVVFSREGLHFPDEMVRHKILDVIGDLALVGIPFEAHVIAIRSGHASNFQLAKKLYNHFTSEIG